jgi:B12-binding domain/radical SAM domain protein
MPKYDVLFFHPPAVYDFRKRPLFPGVLGSSVEAVQFTKVPIGLLSLAEYLDRHGYRVLIDNLGDRMVRDPAFDVKRHIRSSQARIFAIGLHFQWHAQGALEIARLCKQYHPGSLVVLGGMTATCFHSEIIRKFEFIDAVVRGEAEKPFLSLVQGYERLGQLTPSPNLTYRTESGETIVTPLRPPSRNLDEFDYTRFDLMEPQTSIFAPGEIPRWSLEVCRGCTYNCTICGGSAYAYKTYLGMNKPAFRSPGKIISDIRKLNERGIRNIGLYQDPRMAGKKYCQELLAGLRNEKLDIERLSLDLLVPADEEFIQAIASTGRTVTVHICPDTGSDAVRALLGRRYSTDDLLQTVKLCHKYFIPVTSFFSVGLAGETREDVFQTWELWDKLSSMEQIALARANSLGIGAGVSLGGPIIGPIVLDPGSLAFDFPQKYGYKLLYRNLEQYIEGLSEPSWHQWMNYETEILNKRDITELALQSVAFSIDQREQYGFIDPAEAEVQRIRVQADVIAVKEVERLTTLTDQAERESGLKLLLSRYKDFLKTGR